MNAEIICVGTELLLGDILNTNARFLSQHLAEMGFNLFSQSVVGDNAERLEKQISLSMSRSDIIILTGGLGPTSDDITKETVAKVLKRPLVMHYESLELIEKYFIRTGRSMSENNKKQALAIGGATVLKNDHGTAPGYFVKTTNGAIILLPGPPSELCPMFENRVKPLLQNYSNGTILSHNIKVFGIGESLAAERLGDLLDKSNPTVATYAKAGEVDIRVTAQGENYRKADKLITPVISEIKEMFGANIYGVDVDNLQQQVVNLLRENNMKLATAESCTAGMLSGRITEIPGASEVFEMGVTAYANYIKIQALGVDEELITRRGAVCDEVAAQMAIGIRTMCNADIGVGITGVAGPGESEGKPAGLVYVAIADREKVFVRKMLSRGSDRENTRIIATSTALDMVRRYLQKSDDIIAYGTCFGEPIRIMEGYTLPEYVKRFSAFTESPSSNTTAPQVIYNDEELLDIISAVSQEPIEEEDAEKLNIEDDSIDFIFDDEDYILYDHSPVEEENIDSDLNDTIQNSKKKRFLATWLPWKGDSALEIVRKSVFLIAFVVLICTTVYLISYFAEGFKQTGIVDDAATAWESDNSLQKNEEGIFIGFEGLIKANSDIKAWIKIDGTNINNPVYQTTDNDFYINHNMNKEASRYGALFIDKNNVISQDKVSQNTIIYGHHMRDGTMFGDLKNYTDLDFYKDNSIIDYNTLYKEGKYKIFGVFITNTLPEHDNGEVFNYIRTDFSSEQEFLGFVNDIKMRSIIDTGVDVIGTDEILTLSTCTYEFDDARLVVVARRVRDDELVDSNTFLAKVNPKPLYPEIWYTKKGLTKPEFASSSLIDTSSEISFEIIDDESGQEVMGGTDISSSSGVSESSDSVSSANSSDASETSSSDLSSEQQPASSQVSSASE